MRVLSDLVRTKAFVDKTGHVPCRAVRGVQPVPYRWHRFGLPVYTTTLYHRCSIPIANSHRSKPHGTATQRILGVNEP